MRRQELHPRTEVINKTQKNQSKKARYDALAWLAATFPKAFDNTLSINPLKIGIIDDILLHADKAEAAGISRSKLREALVLFTRRIDYLTCLKAREMRIDLEGNPVSEVSESEAEKASMKIKKRVEKCVRNARKLANNKPTGYFGQTITSRSTPQPTNSFTSNDFNPHYVERPPMYSTQPTGASATKPSPGVIVKHKSARQFDPEAVARLKEKLGLSRKAEESKEPTE